MRDNLIIHIQTTTYERAGREKSTYMGYVSCILGAVELWKVKAGIERVRVTDALSDASSLKMLLLSNPLYMN